MSWYLRENSSRGIRLLILGTVELWGEDKSTISRFCLKISCGYANGTDAKDFERGFVKGPIMKPALTFSISSFTMAGSAWAD